MPRPPSLSPGQKQQIRKWVESGLSVDAMATEAAALKWQAKRTAIGAYAQRVREGEPAPAPNAAAKAPPDLPALLARVLDLEGRLAALESRPAAAPQLLPDVAPEAALTRSLATLTDQLQQPGLDPRARAALASAIVEVTKALREYRDEGDTGPELFEP